MPFGEHEAARLADLAAYGVIDTAAEPAFDDIAELAAQICETPMALVSFADERRCWFKARVGMRETEVAREGSFCAAAMLCGEIFVVRDAAADARFHENPIVTRAPGVRFYAGARLITRHGHALGTLCVLDRVPRELSERQLHALQRLARQLVLQLEARRQEAELAAAQLAAELAQDRARLFEQRLAVLLESAPGGIMLLNERGEPFLVAPATTRLLGFTPEELVGRSMFELVHPDDLAPTLQVFAGILATPEGRGSIEFRCRNRAGDWLWFEGVGQNFLHHDCVHAVACHFWDVSPRKAAEAALRESEMRYRHIMDSNMVGILFWHTDGSITEANDCFLEMIGYSREELRAGALRWPALTPPEFAELDRQALERMVHARKCAPFEKEYIRKDGTRLPILIGGAFLDGTNDRGVCFVVDVSDRRQMQAELVHERNLLRTLIDHLPDYVFIKDRDCRYLVNNEANVRLIGAQSMEETIGKTVFDVFPREMAEAYHADDQVVITQGALLLGREEPCTGQNGEPRWLLTTKVPLRDPSGEISGIVGISRDITDRKRTEEMLAYERNLFRAMLDHLPLCVFLVNCEERVMLTNQRHVDLLGLPNSASAEGRPVRDLLPPPLVETELEDVRTVLATGVAVLNRELQFRDRLGRARVHMASKVPLLDAEGRPRAIVCISHDVTERHEAELQIRELAAFPQANPNPVFAFSDKGDLTYFNAAAQLLSTRLGRTHPCEILPPFTVEIVKECLRLGTPKLRLETRHGERTVSWSFFPIAQNNVVHCYAGEITERLALEAQLRQVLKMESVGQLAGGVAHDFNNILTIVHGYASLLSSGDATEEVTEAAQQICQAAERAANLTRQLLAFSRRQVLQPRNLDLNVVVNGMAKMLGRALGEDVALNVRYASNLPPIYADPGMIEQVLLNLAVNARDAMLRGGRLDIQLRAQAITEEHARLHPDNKPGTYVVLTVSDTGCGIPPENLDRIFEPFFTTKEVGRGTGLGLAMVYGIVKQHEGAIRVESTVGRGTTFEIFLPVSERAHTDSAAPRHTPTRGTECVLLVEDEEPLRELVRCILESFGYSVIDAANGRRALEIWKQHRDKIDLLLTDIVMPEGMTGRDLAETLKQDKPSLRVLFSSGYSSDIIGKDFVLADGVNFLQKPYNPQTLAETVRQCLN